MSDVGANVSTETLDEDDYSDILDALKDVAAQCYQIGTWLKLKPSALNLIRADKPSHTEAMERIITDWLSMNYNVDRFGLPTWKVLVEAVAHSLGGNNKGLAMQIAKNHQAGGSAAAPPSTQATPPQPAPHSGGQPVLNGKAQEYLSLLSPNARPHLNSLLDSGHGGVEKDLIVFADNMSEWEEKLASSLGLTQMDISDIKDKNSSKPKLQRREALRIWKNNQGLRATYGNLLELFANAGHTQCAQVLCKVLNEK